MPRPRKNCEIQNDMEPRFYKPQGVSMKTLKVMELSAEAQEALRLADAEGLEHVAAAELMGISRPTFSRLLAEARTIVASALVQGWALDLQGHIVQGVDEETQHKKCGKGLKRHRGFGHGKKHVGGRGLGPSSGGECIPENEDEKVQGMRRRRGHAHRWHEAKPVPDELVVADES